MEPWEEIRLWGPRGLCYNSEDPRMTDVPEDQQRPDSDIAQRCARCPVNQLCLQYALETEAPGGEEGIWGGTTPYQRRQLKSEKSRIYCPGCGSDAVVAQGRGEICLSCGASWIV